MSISTLETSGRRAPSGWLRVRAPMEDMQTLKVKLLSSLALVSGIEALVSGIEPVSFPCAAVGEYP